MTTQEIIIKMQGEPSPSELSVYKVYLASNYASLAGRLKEILVEKPAHWMQLRKDSTSDTQAERAWQRLLSGKEEMAIRLDMKAIEKMLSAISTRIAVATEELKGNF